MKSRNNAGYVRLRSLDPLDQAEIQFNNFAIGGDLDAQAVAEGIQRARDIYASVIPLDGSLTEVIPGLEYQGQVYHEWHLQLLRCKLGQVLYTCRLTP